MLKIMIDLDVLHVEFSRKKDYRKAPTKEFLKKLNEYEIYTPYTLVDIVSKWKDEELASKIKNFYALNSKHIISPKEIADKLEKLNVDENELREPFRKSGIKEEDILLVIVASIFDLDSIITFNKKHLLNNKDEINKILRGLKLNEIDIKKPI